jgi:hypothetical protein
MNRILTQTEVDELLNLPQCEGCEPSTFSFWEGCPVHGWTEYYEEENIPELLRKAGLGGQSDEAQETLPS